MVLCGFPVERLFQFFFSHSPLSPQRNINKPFPNPEINRMKIRLHSDAAARCFDPLAVFAMEKMLPVRAVPISSVPRS